MDYLTKTKKNKKENQKEKAKKHEKQMLIFKKLIEKLKSLITFIY
jgi:hypothetical protein